MKQRFLSVYLAKWKINHRVASYAEYGIKSLKEEKAKAIDQINQLAVTVIKGKDVTVNAPYHEE